MTRHQKRLSAPTSWPVGRKTEVFTVKAGAGPHGESGVPLLILLRDVLEYVESAREADYALKEDMVLVNGSPVSDPRRPIGMFDILAFTERGEYYRVFPDEGGRLALSPIDEDAAGSKLGKIVGKKQVPGGGTQVALHDGETLLVDDPGAYATGDSLVIDNDDGSIVVHFPYEEGALVTAVDGRHAGEIGTIDEIVVTPGSGSNTVRVETDDGGFETVEEYVVVIDETFVEGSADDEAEPDADDEAEPDADDEAEPDADAEAEPDADDEAEPDADDEAEAGAEAEPDADDEAEPDADGVEDGDDDESDGETETVTETDGEAGQADDGESAPDGESEAETESGAEDGADGTPEEDDRE